MTVKILIDCEILGPVRQHQGVNVHDVIARVSTALEGTDTPSEQQLALLQPWFWSEVKWQAWLDDLKSAPFDIEFIGAPPPNTDITPLRDRVVERFVRYAPDPPDGKRFLWGERIDDADENPDRPDQIHWPELLADMAQWPALIPYQLKLCFAFIIPVAKLQQGRLFLSLESLVAGSTKVELQGQKLIGHDRLQATASDGSCELTSWSAAAPGAPDQHQVLDLQRMLIRPRDGGLRQDEDWQQSLPDHIAESSNPASWLPALLRSEWGGPADGQPVEEPIPQHKALALSAASFSHAQLLRRLLAPGLDDSPAYGWLRDLQSGGDADLAAAAGRCADALAVLQPTEDQWHGFVQAIDRSYEQSHPWPDPATLDAMALIAAIESALLARLGDSAVLDLPLSLLELLQAALPPEHRENLQADVARLRQWIASFNPNDRSDPGQLTPEPPRAALALLRSWLTTPLLTTQPPGAPQFTIWRNYLEAVGTLAAKPEHAKLDDWSLHIPGPDPAKPEQSALARIVTAWREMTYAGPAANWPAGWRKSALSNLIDSFGQRPIATQLTDQLHALQLTIDRPGNVTMHAADDLSSRIAGYVGLVRQRLGEPPGEWYPLSLADASAKLFDEQGGLVLDLDLGPSLAPQTIAYIDDQRRLMQCFDGSAWVDDRADRALGEDFGEEADYTRRDSPLDLALQYRLPTGALLPTLKDGVAYDFALLLVGAGNSVHPKLRQASGHPADLDAARLVQSEVLDSVLTDALHPIRAHRTLRVGAPQLRPANDSINAWHDQRRSPVVPLAYERIRAGRNGHIQLADFDERALERFSEAPLSLLVPTERWSGSTRHEFVVHPPQINQAAWLRWWDRSKLEAAEPEQQSIEQHIRSALRMALKQAEEATEQQGNRQPPGFDDPAVAGYLIKARSLVDGGKGHRTAKLFVPVADSAPPDGADEDGRGLWAMRPLQRPMFSVQLATEAAQELLAPAPADVGKPPRALLNGRPGQVFAVEIHAAVLETHFAKEGNEQARFVAASEIADKHTQGAQTYRLFAPARMLVEVATEAMPGAEELWQRLRPRLNDRRLEVDLDCNAPGDLLYADRHRLRVQRWNWRGRPVAAFPDPKQAGAASESEWIDELFDGRSDQDVQEIERRAIANDQPTRLFDHDLSEDDRADVWRFALISQSRYAAIAPDDLQRAAAPSTPAESAFKSLTIPQRGSRPMPRPKVDICLPLMRELPLSGETDSAEQLAFLVELDEGWHAEAGPAERFVAEVVQTAHYPRIDGDPDLLPEIAPLPQFSTAVWPDSTAPLKTLAVYGQTLDPDSGAARYARASAVVTLDEQATKAAKASWNRGSLMLKARFGRRVAGSLDDRDPSARTADATQWSADYWIELPPPSHRVGPYAIAPEVGASAASDTNGDPPDTQRWLLAQQQAGADLTGWLRLQTTSADQVQLMRVAGGAAATAQAMPLRLSAEQMPRPFGWLVLTEAVSDARGKPGGERLLDIKLLQANQEAPPWDAHGRPIDRLRGYVYWLEAQPGTTPSSVADLAGANHKMTAIEVLKTLFTPSKSRDAQVRVVQFTRAIRG